MNRQQTDRPTIHSIFSTLHGDQRGLSTMEYAVIFIVILIGSLTIWHKLGKGAGQHVEAGTDAVQTTLGSHQSGDGTEPQPSVGEMPHPSIGTVHEPGGNPHTVPAQVDDSSHKRALTH